MSKPPGGKLESPDGPITRTRDPRHDQLSFTRKGGEVCRRFLKEGRS